MGSHTPVVKPYTSGPKKRLGQHFLRDTGVIDRIVRWIEPQSRDLIIEIGAGKGALSLSLASHVEKLVAVEVDVDCIQSLETALGAFTSASVVQADILKLDLHRLIAPLLTPGMRVRIAGNLPYNISTTIIKRFLLCEQPVHDMTFMVQTEVAQRIAACPGSRQYGYLSILCQHYSLVRLGFKVSPSCFVPRPKVSSSMIALMPRENAENTSYSADFECLGKAAFSHRRKTLANSLAKHKSFSAIYNRLLQEARIDGSRRAEDLSVGEFELLARIFQKLKADPKFVA
ncbi:MAG: 16S rRNA (adenine(1518)-N(6)/adenine(1519)-N(6))-dimethyltransferase RsmA [Acidobacteriota bacterium]